jgi:glycogen synthase
MNIAIVTPEFVTESGFDGGLATYTHRLAKSLIQFGHKPTVFVTAPIDEKINYDGIDVYRVDILKYDEGMYSNKYLSGLYTKIKRILNQPSLRIWEKWEHRFALKIQSYALNRQLKLVHRSTPFDIIHYSNLTGVGYYRPKNIPAIARLSGSCRIWFEHGGYGESKENMLRQEDLENKSLRKMDMLFGPCRSISDMVEKKINRKIELIESIYIDETKAEDPSIYNEQLKGKKYLLFYGTISLVKGVNTIADIIYQFLEKHNDHFFVLVGKSTHSQIEGIKMIDFLKQKAGIHQNRVIHINKISHDKLFPVLKNAEFVVLPSRIDNFPNTCIESMAHQKIVIGTIGNGFEQLIEHKKNGYLIPIDAPDKLLESIEQILKLSKEEKKQMEVLAQKRIEKLTPENIAPQVIEFYKRAILKHKAN